MAVRPIGCSGDRHARFPKSGPKMRRSFRLDLLEASAGVGEHSGSSAEGPREGDQLAGLRGGSLGTGLASARHLADWGPGRDAWRQPPDQAAPVCSICAPGGRTNGGCSKPGHLSPARGTPYLSPCRPRSGGDSLASEAGGAELKLGHLSLFCGAIALHRSPVVLHLVGIPLGLCWVMECSFCFPV